VVVVAAAVAALVSMPSCSQKNRGKAPLKLFRQSICRIIAEIITVLNSHYVSSRLPYGENMSLFHCFEVA